MSEQPEPAPGTTDEGTRTLAHGKSGPPPAPDTTSEKDARSYHTAALPDTGAKRPVVAVLPEVPGYELLHELGRGGMGVVYKARQVGLNRVVALKMILTGPGADEEETARFLAEAESIAALQHPHIVQVHDTGRVGPAPYLTLEYLPGGSLADRLAEGPMPPREAARVVEQIARGMAHAHTKGIVHRDLKPGNILFGPDGSPKVTDFGLVKRLGEAGGGELTVTGRFMGTPYYAAPEQASGKAKQVGPPADVYALGVILYECLTGVVPFRGDSLLETLDLVSKRDPVPPRLLRPGVPKDLNTVCLRCLSKPPGDRYRDAAGLADDLGRFLRGEPVHAQPPSLTYLTVKFVRRHRAPLAVAAAVAAILVGGAVAAFVRIDRERRTALTANEQLEEQLYDNRVAVAERELTLNQDVGLAGNLLELCPARLRGWEWDYLMRLRDGNREPLAGPDGHKAGLWTALFNRDGTQVATASIDGTAKVWDVAAGRPVRTYTGHLLKFPFAPRVPVTCLAYSPDGRSIASAGLVPNKAELTNPRKAYGVVKVWDPDTLRESATYDRLIGMVYCLAFSPDGTRIATSHINDEKVVAVWDARTGAEIHLFRNPSHAHRLRFSPDGRLLLAGCTDGVIRVWDAATFEPVRTLEAHPAPIYDLAFNPAGNRFASTGVDGLVRVWDAATYEVVQILRGHTGASMGVTFSPDGRRIASAGYDKTVRLWDAATGKEKITLRGHSDMVCSVDFSPDGRKLVSASFDKEARVWDATPPDEPTGPGLFALDGEPDRVNAVAFSRDGRLLASGGWNMTIRLSDGQTGREVRTLKGHTACVWGLAFSPDGKRLASTSWDHTVKLWDVSTGNELFTFRGHGAPAHGVAFDRDGRRLVSTSWDGLVKVWDPDTGKELLTFGGHLFPAMTAAFSPDGTRVASGSGDRTVKVWDSTTGREAFTLKGHDGLVHSVAFSPDGSKLASASWDHTVKVWDAKTGKELLTFKEHSDRVQGVAFSPDGSRIASASEDKTLRVWDVKTGKELRPPNHHRGLVWSVATAPDGKRAAVGCWSTAGWVKTWNVE